MLTLNTNIFSNFYVNSPFQKNSCTANSFKALNKDIFQKIYCKKPSFKGDKDNINPERTLLDVKKDILRLMCSILMPVKFWFDQIEYFINALEEGSTLEDAIKNVPDEKFDPKSFDSRIGSKTIREHLLDFEHLQRKLEPLYSELDYIEQCQKKSPKEPIEVSQEIQDYMSFAKKSNSDYTSTPNFSKPLRYRFLAKDFFDMVNDNVKLGKQTKMLLVGLGNSCEELHDYALYSSLALKNSNKNINDILDLEIVDFRGKDELVERDYLTPMPFVFSDNSFYPLNSEIRDRLIDHPMHRDKTYPLDVLEFVADKLEDKSKFHHSTPIEDFAEKYKSEGYDFVSINNVLQYVGQAKYENASRLNKKYRFLNPFKSNEDLLEYESKPYREFLQNILKMVKPGGLLSCQFDTNKYHNILREHLSGSTLFNDEFEEVHLGLYRRKKQ